MLPAARLAQPPTTPLVAHASESPASGPWVSERIPINENPSARITRLIPAETLLTDREAWDVVYSFRSSSRNSIVVAACITCWLGSLLPDLAAHRPFDGLLPCTNDFREPGFRVLEKSGSFLERRCWCSVKSRIRG